MFRSRAYLFLFPAVLLLITSAVAGDIPELEFEEYTLDNGLTVILHEDHTTPMVAVNVWYHAGSKNDKPGRTGVAHLIEHLMFQGSKHLNEDYHIPLHNIGAEINGKVWKDRSNYWETVPAEQLELALWMEADRMGYLLDVLDDDKLLSQKTAVENDKLWSNVGPYTLAEEMLTSMIYPPEHPYSWSISGRLDDLSVTSLEDISEFLELYYIPNNASLSIAGDFNPTVVKEMVARYFGSLKPGRPVKHQEKWIPVLDIERRAIAKDLVELPRLYMRWPTPGCYEPGGAEFGILRTILGDGKSSRLYKKLVHDLKIAQDVEVILASMELCSEFDIIVTAAPGYSLTEVEAAVDYELSRVLEDGISEEEVKRAYLTRNARVVRGLQRIGGYGGKADLLNRYHVLANETNYLENDMGRYSAATPEGVIEHARKYLGFDQRAVLYVVPQGNLIDRELTVDLDNMPGSSGNIPFTPPPIQVSELENGLKLYLVENHKLPLVEIHMTFLSGWASDPIGKPGTSALTADLLDEGIKGKDAAEFSDAVAAIGAEVASFSFFDGSVVVLNVLKSELTSGLDLMADLILNPTFPVEEFDRLKQNYIGRHQQESVQPYSQGLKELQKRTFGESHPYAQAFTGTGTPASIAAITVEDLIDFHDRHYRPNNASLIVVGDMTMNEAKYAAEEAFRKWDTGAPVTHNIPPFEEYIGPLLVVLDSPGAQQSLITAGYAGMKRNDPDFDPFSVMNMAFGVEYASRINMNLREDKGYSYNVRSALASFNGGGLYLLGALVQTKYTKESIAELIAEMQAIRGERPLTPEELSNSKSRLIKSFPQQFQTIGGVAGGLNEMLTSGLPLDHWNNYDRRIASYSEADIARVVREHLDPQRVVWIIVGDWQEIESGLRELDLGPIEVISPGD